MLGFAVPLAVIVLVVIKDMPLDAKIPSGPIEKKWQKASST